MRNLYRILLVFFIAGASVSARADQNTTLALDALALNTVADLPPIEGTVGIGPLSGKPLLVTFFASWCPPCREEFSHLNALHKKYAETDLNIVAINVYEAWDENDAERMRKFIDTTKPMFPAVKGSEAIRDLFGGIDRIPTVLGFDADGRLAYRFIHKRGAKKTNASIEELDSAAKMLLGSL